MKALRIYSSHSSGLKQNIAAVHDGKTILEKLAAWFVFYKIDDDYFTVFETTGGSGYGYSAGEVIGKWRVKMFDQIDKRYIKDSRTFFHIHTGEIKELI